MSLQPLLHRMLRSGTGWGTHHKGHQEHQDQRERSEMLQGKAFDAQKSRPKGAVNAQGTIHNRLGGQLRLRR